MASLRTVLSEDNMDVVMYLVRKFDKNPSDIINMIIENPTLLIDARSEVDECNEKGRLTCKKQ
ncbi:hypothetical protein 2018Mat167_0490 [Vibrio phage ICP1]|uniref:Uncharacterized protein ORF99 n=1 Tax=Vibrio phage ICP1 TaxID=979525 RepID=F1D1C1_9CAUD|nr:hypothetical protein ViPhICP1_gp099 [Vibrio phage ICP1]ADX88145.1 hypothetical protein TUST1-191_00495 [Vibrio phage ICP1_2006_D]ADX88372.1 hypothetical protein TUST1-182_00495 [Vibrio phage ICP1_2006_C]ADX88599.1 hypothetical protein TUST1-159_00495 [Vibrio phage ICP1_2006_B]ADX88825.1 hypothetical protein TUST1-17_00495 [Vibrio phage ICP1_2006_A]ADX89056.1 hypothetical protein TUST1-15_00520 [Vibrio phage ICP1_2005_A]ADX89282.1 hypothetical protein TUST1-2_00500 [Vibrio phage ICP1_2001_A